VGPGQEECAAKLQTRFFPCPCKSSTALPWVTGKVVFFKISIPHISLIGYLLRLAKCQNANSPEMGIYLAQCELL
jgi:hypothetical protein